MTHYIHFAILESMQEEQKTSDKKEYELSFLLSEAAAISEIDKALVNVGAEVGTKGQVSEIRLSYPIKKHTSANFGYYHFTAHPEDVVKVKEELKLNPKVLRTLLLTPPVKQMLREPRPIKPIESKKEVAPKVEEPKPAEPRILSNEGLEKKLEEILK